MPFDKLKQPNQLWEERRKSVQESVRAITVDELNKIAKEHEEEFVGDPWRDEFLRLIQEQPHASFFRAMPQPDVDIYYCQDVDFGVWVVRGSGSGPLDETGKRLMKEVIGGSGSDHKLGGKK